MAENGEGDGWTVVQRRKGKSDDDRKKEGVTTFFFRNFPDYCSVDRLWRKFEEVGKVVDVFIPTKRDQNGHRFGFVRMADVAEGSGMLKKLNNVWVDSFIIRAFVPRFFRAGMENSGMKAKGGGKGRKGEEERGGGKGTREFHW